jgi:hypothetical protein
MSFRVPRRGLGPGGLEEPEESAGKNNRSLAFGSG